MRMRWLGLIALLTLTVVPVLAQEQAGEQGGTIAVRCPPGTEVYLDGTLMGVTAAEEKGKLLEGVAPGKREVRLVRTGYEPKMATVMVSAGTTVEVKAGPFVPVPTPQPAAQPAHQHKGSFKVAPPPQGARPRRPDAVSDAPVTDAAPAEPRPAAGQPAGVASPEKPSSAAIVSHSGAILFLRARGVTAGDGRAVHIWSLPGAGGEPQEIFVCRDGKDCMYRYPDRLAPGPYRFRIGFRHLEGEPPDATTVFSADVEVELQAVAGRYFVVEADYGGDSVERCTARVVMPEPGLK